MDRLESMAVFIDVVGAGSLAGAADRRGLSPSMVGKHLRALETRLGVRLLHRTTRRQHLTEAGELFLERCQEVLRQIEAAEGDAAALRSDVIGLLRISAPVSFGVTRLAPAIASFQSEYQHINIDLALTDAAVDPFSDGVDLAFRIGPISESSVVARPLLQYYQMVVCAAPTYLALHGIPKRPQDLAQHTCLGHTRWGLRGSWRFKSEDGLLEVPVNYRLRIDSGLALREAAIAGAGIILQPFALVQDDIELGRLERLLGEYEARGRQLYLTHAPDLSLPAKTRAFIEFSLNRFSAITEEVV